MQARALADTGKQSVFQSSLGVTAERDHGLSLRLSPCEWQFQSSLGVTAERDEIIREALSAGEVFQSSLGVTAERDLCVP